MEWPKVFQQIAGESRPRVGGKLVLEKTRLGFILKLVQEFNRMTQHSTCKLVLEDIKLAQLSEGSQLLWYGPCTKQHKNRATYEKNL